MNRDIILTKVDYSGIKGTVLDWFKSYISDWQQYASVNGSNWSYQQRVSSVLEDRETGRRDSASAFPLAEPGLWRTSTSNS